MHKIIYYFALILLLIGCDSRIRHSESDQIKLSNKSNGFSLSEGLVILYQILNCTDIQVYANRIGNTIIGVNLFSGNVRSNFL